MANRWASLDPTWAHHPAPAPAAAAGHCCYSSSPTWLSNPAAAFENEALTSALRASMSPAAAASSASYPTTPSSSSTSSASELLSGGHDAPAAAPDRPSPEPAPPAARGALLARRPAGGRVAKRKTRPSRSAQTTYISADPADFRRMVQEITGLPVAPGPSSSSAAASANAAAAPSWTAPPQAFVLPTLDTSAFLLDRAAAAAPRREDKGLAAGGAAPAMAVTAAAAAAEEDEASAVLLELEAMAGAPGGGGFPTLESWGII